jgi:hypothetical protein
MPDNAVLAKMLERLYSAILSGPAINCRPHSSRQRVDLSQLGRLDVSANDIIAQLLGLEAKTKLAARAAEPPLSWLEREDLDEQQKTSVAAWQAQQSLLRKLKVIAEDAAAYQQDTGVNALCLGFPILSFPPRSEGDRTLKRILAPVVFVPIQMEVRSARGAGLTLQCAEGGIDRVFPNPGLLVWVEKQTGHKLRGLFEDENGEDPWREIAEAVNAVCSALELPAFSMSPETPLIPVPKGDSDDLQQPGILPSAVLGLFPLSNQGLIRDTTELIEAGAIEGPLTSFLTVSEPLAGSHTKSRPAERPQDAIHDEFLVSAADPCQARAVRLARTARGLVVHGPPGTGKSQTITNVIGDHLARGQRVLFVCDKRTALEIEQSFLDVHYRSRNADLISFSNDHFYQGRLQPIPAHPANRAKTPPLRLTHVAGVYEEQTNRKEAEKVVAIVRELLDSPKPPSLGVACFNLPQKDLISDLLAEAAESDPQFAERYQVALKRSGVATFEGLFVKNLENVQGDERDHIIISTTYGPDAKGKFRRQFGPLNRAGGGRRLNVLVTRAREAVHLVTSVPRAEYLAAPPTPAGQNPNGGYLLFSYLRFAERLAQFYADVSRNEVLAITDAMVTVRPTRTPSEQAVHFAEHLRDQLMYSSDVYWGNEGFCVDIAVQHPHRPEDVTVGVICDGTRYDKTDDVIEWDVFRTEILESQGWQLIRSFSPALFRDFENSLAKIRELHDKLVAADLAAISGQSESIQ